MFKLVIAVFFVQLHLVLGASFAPADDDAKAVVERAIKAHGGEAALAKMKVMEVSVLGRINLPLGGGEHDFVSVDTRQDPSQLKTVFRVEVGDRDIEVIEYVNGNTRSLTVNGVPKPQTDDTIANSKEHDHARFLERLGFYQDNSYKLETDKDSMFDGVPVNGVKITFDGHREVILYFDKASGLLIGSKRLMLVEGKEVVEENAFGDFKDYEGLKHFTKTICKRGGKKVSEGKVKRVTFFDKLDEKTFEPPLKGK